ncbi:cytochrome b5-related protein-like [Culicoides brevitarsis]|uniref:cytochrome b5-related protein-like n=1 Tax=Culicoides brevitarsis TaxID=469753 RepID=UPI00307C70B5
MEFGKTGIPPSISHKYPTNRDVAVRTGYIWLDGRRQDENAEGLWRIYDNLYDFTDFIKRHPGGPDWLALTKGCDITETFESHHISLGPEQLLPKYFVRKAKLPRNFKLTLHEDGFYKTLKRKVREKLPSLDRKKEVASKRVLDTCLAVTFLFAIASARFHSYLLAIVAGVFLNYTVISAHNFFHQKDNWRMKMWNLSLFSYREWRISHAMSHHIYTNTLHDLEISYFEPFFNWLPSPNIKSTFGAIFSSLIAPIVYVFAFFMEFTKRLYLTMTTKQQLFHTDDVVVPLSLPFAMLVFGSMTPQQVFTMWIFILAVGSFVFGCIGLNAAHHHPEIVHEGDALNPKLDWGIFQLDAVMDRTEIQGIWLTLTHFGDHALHHLFPTIDHIHLPELQPLLLETCKEFEAVCRECRWWELIKGQFQQLGRTEVNPVPVSLRKNNIFALK